MKKYMHKALFCLLISSVSGFALHLQPVGFDALKDSVIPNTGLKFFIGEDAAQKQNMLETLKVEYKALLEKSKLQSDAIEKQMVAVKKEIDNLKTIDSNSSNEYLSKKLNLLNNKYQLLPDVRETRQQIAEYMKQHIEYLDKYFQSLDDQNDEIEEKSLYAFSDLQLLTHKIMLEQEALARLQIKKENEESVVVRSENFIATKDKEIKAINDYIESLKKSNHADVKNQLLLYNLEKEVLIQERELDALRVEEHVRSAEFITSQMFVTAQKKNKLEANLVQVRRRMKVDKQDVLFYQQKNNEIKSEVQASKINLMKDRTDLANQKSYMQEELEKLSDRYKISLSNIRQVEEWDVASDTIQEDFQAISVSLAYLNVAFIDQKIEKIRIELLIQDAKIFHAQALEDAVQSLYAITQSQFHDNDHLETLRNHYKDTKNSIQNMIKSYQDRTGELHTLIKSQHKKLQNIKKYQERLKSYPSTEITENQRKYNESLTLLTKSLKAVERQGDVYLKLSEQYAALIELKEESLILTNFMLQELDLIGVWHRSNRAVTLNGIKEIIPNLITFVHNIYGMIQDYIVHFNFFDDAYNFITTSTSQFFTYMLLGIFFYIIYLCLLIMLPALYNSLMLVSTDMHNIFLLSRMFAVMCGFIQEHLGLIYLWILLFMSLSICHYSIVFVLMFYTFSIVLLTYLSRSFLVYLLDFNKSIGYLLLGESFQNRFRWIFSFFSISTITILFFRKMFMLVMMYQQSEFPIILLRLYHVVIFISVVFSIEKDELLNLIPKTNIYFEEFSKLVDRYYYILSLFCIVMLILSDPYLGGYGHLMWYMILNITMTVILLAAMYLIHNAIKSISSLIFFKDNSEFGKKERFDYAKTWYAIFVVILFFLFLALTILLIAQIWGYPIAFDQIDKFLNYHIYYGSAGSKLEFIRVAGCIRLLFSPIIGAFLAFLFRRYVLQRVFDIQYVDPGVQDTVMTISRYVIISATIFIMLELEGLGFLVGYILGIGLVTFGWTFKDLFADVVAYFFILVQRQVKVGDFIKIDDHVLGVVKKIGPRAVILRRKNSVTIVVPNSQILKSPIYNWNYTRGYLAFDDIVFSVPFDCDPQQVKSILSQVLDENNDVLKVPEPLIRLDDFNDKGYIFMVRGYISSTNTLNQWKIASDIRLAIVMHLKAHGISVAQPVMNIIMK